MAQDTSLGSQILAKELRIQHLLAQASIVGGVFTMGYDECMVLTNDLWKAQAGGVPQHCFLLACAFTPGSAPMQEDEEVILLRVTGPADLPAERELVQVRAEAMREMVVSKGAAAASTPSAILDILTRNEIQFSGIRAKVLGTFYDTSVNGTPILSFGNDVETFYSSSRYKVFKPHGDSLAIIGSFPEMTEDEERERQGGKPGFRRVQIGTIRYSSTNRRRRLSQGTPQDIAVPVKIRVEDFVSMKTAVFGMTRLGKSNTMKTIATAVAQYGAETKQKIGQLLFDPAAEYAQVNVQDGTALSAIGTEFVTLFRYGATGTEAGVRPLSVNFFADNSIEVAWGIICSSLSIRNQSNYIQSFISADVMGPENPQDDQSAYNRARRRRAALYATLIKAGFRPHQNFTVSFAINAQVLTEVNQQIQGHPQFQSGQGGQLRLSASELPIFWDALLRAQAAGAPAPTGRGTRAAQAAAAATQATTPLGQWIDPQLDAILALYGGSVGSGYRLLEPLRVFHAPTSVNDYAADILTELIAGKIVIVDLSRGTENVLKYISERIIHYIVRDAARRFADGQEPNKIQIYLEEAHRLFNRDRMSAPEEADPYVRLAKEAAKFKIGLIYATQEVSSVDALVLSNTSNWIVTHLNNQAEVKELSKYYDFEDFADLTLKSEDVGFARIKTRSGRYIIPTQISKFDAALIAEARTACLKTLPAAKK